MGKKGPYIKRDVYVEGETVKIWGTIENPIENYGEIWPNIELGLFFECPKIKHPSLGCFYPFWPTWSKDADINWKFRPGEKYPYEGTYEFKFKAKIREALKPEKPCGITTAQRWKAVAWYGPHPSNIYAKTCEQGGSWNTLLEHPRCLGILEWTVTKPATPPPTPPPPEAPTPPPEKPKVGYLLPLAAIPVAAVSAIVVFHEVSKRK